MATSKSTGTPNNIPFPAPSDLYQLTTDLQTIVTQVDAALNQRVTAKGVSSSSETGDLNTLTTPGLYGYYSTWANIPESGNGTVITLPILNSGGVQQVAFPTGYSRTLYKRFFSSSWSSWVKIGIDEWDYTGTALTESSDLSTLPNGFYATYASSITKALGLPGEGIGTLLSIRFGNTGMQLWISGGLTQNLYTRSLLSGGWTPWLMVGGAGSSSSLVGGLKAASPGSLKTAPLPFTLGRGGYTTTGSGTTVVTQYMPLTVTRARVHIRNWNPRFELADSDKVSLSSVSLGLHSGNGALSTQINLPGGSTEYTSKYVDIPSSWLGQEIALKYTWSSSGTIQRNIGNGWENGSKENNPVLFVWLEVEVPAETPVVAAFGDSIATGVGSTRPVVDSWIDQWARAHGAVPTHWSHSGDGASTWTSDTPRKWGLYGDSIAAPDALIYAMGFNDIFGSSPSVSEMQQRITDNVSLIKQKITPNIYGGTITPHGTITGTQETTRRSVNSWAKSWDGYRAVFDFASAISTDDETLISEYNYDGLHYRTSGYAKFAELITGIISASSVRTGFVSMPLPSGMSGEIKYIRDGHFVHIYASNVRGKEGTATLGTLPKGLWPPATQTALIYNSASNSNSELRVAYNGAVTFNAANDTAWLSASVTYRTAYPNDAVV